MRDDGSYTDGEWDTIINEGGADVIPSVFGIEYGEQIPRSTPSTSYSWLCSAIGLVLLLPSFVGLGLAIRCIRRGNRWGWLALAGAVASIVLFVWMIAVLGLNDPEPVRSPLVGG